MPSAKAAVSKVTFMASASMLMPGKCSETWAYISS